MHDEVHILDGLRVDFGPNSSEPFADDFFFFFDADLLRSYNYDIEKIT